jgi:hypothetical protein
VGTLILEVRGKEQHVSFSGCEHIEEELRVYCNAVENAEDPPVSGEIGLYVQAVIGAIYESGAKRSPLLRNMLRTRRASGPSLAVNRYSSEKRRK